ncbi:MAG: hypothetical protein EOP49_07810 [Sphingobacteriales bacterium]|nr:MAG: hypothetical protein EOP49_07810 [Sphingobacteriales bacterium]
MAKNLCSLLLILFTSICFAQIEGFKNLKIGMDYQQVCELMEAKNVKVIYKASDLKISSLQLFYGEPRLLSYAAATQKDIEGGKVSPFVIKNMTVTSLIFGKYRPKGFEGLDPVRLDFDQGKLYRISCGSFSLQPETYQQITKLSGAPPVTYTTLTQYKCPEANQSVQVYGTWDRWKNQAGYLVETGYTYIANQDIPCAKEFQLDSYFLVEDTLVSKRVQPADWKWKAPDYTVITDKNREIYDEFSKEIVKMMSTTYHGVVDPQMLTHVSKPLTGFRLRAIGEGKSGRTVVGTFQGKATEKTYQKVQEQLQNLATFGTIESHTAENVPAELKKYWPGGAQKCLMLVWPRERSPFIIVAKRDTELSIALMPLIWTSANSLQKQIR